MDIRILAVQDSREGTMVHIGQDTRGGPKALASCDIESGGYAPTNLKVRSNHQDPTLGSLKRQEGHEAGLAAAHRNLEDGVFGAVPERLARAKPPLDLGITQIGVTLNEGPRGVEESGYFLVCHSFSVQSLS